MLKGTSHKPDEIVNPKMGPMDRIVTVEKVAINAVMAGCKPEQLPLCLAITEGGLKNAYGSSGSMGIVNKERVMRYDRDSWSHRLLDSMDRRTLLGRGAAMMGGLLAALSLRPSRAYGQAKPTAGNQQGSNAWNVVVVGEAMVSRP